MKAQEIAGVRHTLIVLAQLEQVELLMVGIPIGTNTFKTGCTIMERMGCHAHFRLTHWYNPPLKVGIALLSGKHRHTRALCFFRWCSSVVAFCMCSFGLGHSQCSFKHLPGSLYHFLRYRASRHQ